MLTLLLALMATVDPPPSAHASAVNEAEQGAARVLEQLAAGEPTIEEVQSAAARTTPNADRVESLGSRVRASPWLPKISAAYRHEDRNTRVVGLESSGSEVDYMRLIPGDSIEVKASWDLDQIIFAPSEMQVTNAMTQLAKEREERVERATRIYFERKKRLLDLAADPPTSLQDRAERELAIESLTADLDALTHGLFRRRGTR